MGGVEVADEVSVLRAPGAHACARRRADRQKPVRETDRRRPAPDRVCLRQRAGTPEHDGPARSLSAARLREIIGDAAFQRLIREAPGARVRIPSVDPFEQQRRRRRALKALDSSSYSNVARRMRVSRRTVVRWTNEK